MEGTAGLLARAKAGDRDAMNDAITAFIPWARKRSKLGGGWPWRSRDDAFSVALESLWSAIKVLPDGWALPTGVADDFYKRRVADELRTTGERSRRGVVRPRLVDIDRTGLARDPARLPLDAMIAREDAERGERLAARFKAEHEQEQLKRWAVTKEARRLERQALKRKGLVPPPNPAAKEPATEGVPTEPESEVGLRGLGEPAAAPEAIAVAVLRRVECVPDDSAHEKIPRPPEVNHRPAPDGLPNTVQ